MSFTSHGLAWNNEVGERKRLLRIASVVCPVFLLATFYISWINLPEQNREELEAIPPQLAKVILKKKELPKPIVAKQEKKIEEKKVEPEKKLVEKPKPEVKKPEPQIAKKPKPRIKPKKIELAREKAKTSGLLAMSSQLSALSSLADTVKLDTPKMITAKPIARKASDKLASSVSTVRSSGVDESQLNHDVKKMTLAAREVTELEHAEELAEEIVAEELLASADNLTARRTSEDVRRIMDANKSAINSIYNRALRKKPSLRGILTPELVIEENGSVSSCAMVESTLNEPRLEGKICKRLRLVDFGAKPGVDQTTIRYPIELLPG